MLIGLGSNDLRNQGKLLLQLNHGFGELEHQLVLRNCYTSTFGTFFLRGRSPISKRYCLCIYRRKPKGAYFGNDLITVFGRVRLNLGVET